MKVYLFAILASALAGALVAYVSERYDWSMWLALPTAFVSGFIVTATVFKIHDDFFQI